MQDARCSCAMLVDLLVTQGATKLNGFAQINLFTCRGSPVCWARRAYDFQARAGMDTWMGQICQICSKAGQ